MENYRIEISERTKQIFAREYGIFLYKNYTVKDMAKNPHEFIRNRTILYELVYEFILNITISYEII